MAEAPDNVPEEGDATEQQADKDATDSADLQQQQQIKELDSQPDARQSEARAASSKRKKKKDKPTNQKSSDEKSSVPMSNVKNLQELINKLSSMPTSLTGLSETDGSSKGHEFWDTQPVPKLGNSIC